MATRLVAVSQPVFRSVARQARINPQERSDYVPRADVEGSVQSMGRTSQELFLPISIVLRNDGGARIGISARPFRTVKSPSLTAFRRRLQPDHSEIIGKQVPPRCLVKFGTRRASVAMHWSFRDTPSETESSRDELVAPAARRCSEYLPKFTLVGRWSSFPPACSFPWSANSARRRNEAMDLGTYRRPSAIGVWAGGALVSLCLAGCGRPSDDSVAREGESAAELPRAEALYAQHCGACHGDKGDGKGLAAVFLFPKPRDFRSGRFRLVSTANSVPTLEDIVAVIDRGIPGSSMPPWAHLASEDRRLLAEQVLELRRQGARDVELALAAEEEIELSDQELEEAVARVTTPGPVLEVPEFGEPTDEAIARGKKLYLAQGCASCHGKEGKGDGAEVQIDAEGYLTRPRDYTQGIFKGGHDPASLYLRIAYGMPGTPMPSSKQLAPEQNAEMVHFIRSMSDEQTRQAAVLKREQLTAKSVSQIPSEPDAAGWQEIEPVQLGMMPLYWRDDFVKGFEVRALHDGSRLALHLSWDDAEKNASSIRTEDFSDAAAVQLSLADEPPFFGMGDTKGSVNIWYWKADRPTGGETVAGIESAYPNMIVTYYPFQKSQADGVFGSDSTIAEQDPTFVAGWGSGNPVSQPQAATPAENLNANGFGTLSAGAHVRALVGGQAVWTSGRWQLVLSRELEATDEGAIPLEPGETISVGFAVWDGMADDRDGQKNVTIWHKLSLEN